MRRFALSMKTSGDAKCVLNPPKLAESGCGRYNAESAHVPHTRFVDLPGASGSVGVTPT
jgi:hypothetical protein